jgi:CheY-like chemotaxis protein
MHPLRDSHCDSDVRCTVLIAEDQDSLRNHLYRVLENAGYDVLAAGNGRDAISICQKSIHPIDLLVTDYNMPQMTGLEIAHECTRFYSELRVLYISGSNPDEALRADLELHNRGFLAKPFRGEELRRKVREALLLEPAASWSAPKHAFGRAASISPAKGIAH